VFYLVRFVHIFGLRLLQTKPSEIQTRGRSVIQCQRPVFLTFFLTVAATF